MTVSQRRATAVEDETNVSLAVGRVEIEVALGLRGPSGSGLNIESLPLAPNG